MSYGRPSIDLESYASLYRGRSKIKRLQHIAATSKTLEVDALQLAVKEALCGRDTVLYKALITSLNSCDADMHAVDESWVTNQDSWASKELDKLRAELEQFKTVNSRETVRTAHMDLGDFYHFRGKLQQARGEYIKSRDHCVQPGHNLQMCLRTIVVSIEAGDFAGVENYHHMAENAMPEVPPSGNSASASGSSTAPKSEDLALVRAAAGLSLLVRNRYHEAAEKFLSVATDASEDRIASLSEQFGEPLSLEDVATFGALTSLATFDRGCLKSKVLENPAFCTLLELVPDVRELIRDFHASRYTRCFNTLDALRKDLELDLFVGKEGHVDKLYAQIRQEALVQYVSPFLTADLARMAVVFKTTAPKLDAELFALIESGAIPARIDTQKRALYRKTPHTRTAALENAVNAGKEAFNDVEAMMLRMSLIKNGLFLQNQNSSSANYQQRFQSLLNQRSGSINSITDSGFERFGGAG